jgi:nucleotide-binding universal stress UspA family protein
MRSIVVGVDESAGAAAALRWAAAERALDDCALTAVLCWTYLEQHRSQPKQHFDPEYGDAAAREALDSIVEQVLGSDATNVERRTVNDHTARGLLDASADADLLVLGARGLSGWREVVVGSVTRQCLHHATKPIAVIRQRADGGPEPDSRPEPEPSHTTSANRVVVGVDGSESSVKALHWALDEARRRGAALTAVHVWTPPFIGPDLVPSAAYDTDENDRRGREVLESALAAADTSGLAAPVEPVVVSGGASTALVDAADGADLLVVGSRGHGGFAGLLLGSVSHHAVHHAACPVVVVPHGRQRHG